MLHSGIQVRVCEDKLFWWVEDTLKWVAPTLEEAPKDKEIHKGFAMTRDLKNTLDSMAYNLDFDMDFVIIITGGGDVRVGKSVLAMQIGYYLACKLGSPFSLANVCYESKELMDFTRGKRRQVLVYDEARESLNTGMWFDRIQRAILRFFTQCGQLNNVYILVMPDFFELNKRLSITRSELLIDCNFKKVNMVDKDGCPVVKKERGHFRAFKKDQKRLLYIYGSKELNYFATKADYGGTWDNVYPFNEKDYRAKKAMAMEELTKKEIGVVKFDKRTDKHRQNLVAMIKSLSLRGMTHARIAALVQKDEKWVGKVLVSKGGDIVDEENL